MPEKKNKRTVQSGDFSLLKLPHAVAVSPDGARIAYTLQRCDMKQKKYFANLHVLDTATGEDRAWTFGDHTDRAPVWSHDGGRLVFLRQEKGEDRIYLISTDGGQPMPVCRRRGRFAGIRWSTDDDALFVRFRKADPDPEAEKAIREGREPESRPPAARRITRLFYRLDGEGFLPQDSFQIYRVDPESGEMVQLTKGSRDVTVFDISPDGRSLAFVMNSSREPDRNPFHQQIFLLNLRTRNKKSLNVELGEKSALAYSPNGKYIVYIGHHNLQDAWGVEPVHPWLVNLKTGREKNLTPKFDRQAGDLTVSDLGYGLDIPKIKWSADSRSVFYQVSDEGDTYLVRKGLAQGTPLRVWKPKGQVADFDVTAGGIGVLHLDNRSFADLHFAAYKGKKIAFRKLTDFNREYRRSREFGRVREVSIRSMRGVRVQGWVVLPPKFNPERKYPAILEVHGGPRTQYGRIFFHEIQYLAAQGYVILFTNPRGSQGRGEEFAGCITGAWGTHDFNDVMAAADWLERQPFVNRNRIGITGGSYGGYMTNLCMGRTRRFRAGVTQRSVADLFSFTGTSDIGQWDYLEFCKYYWEDPDNYAKMSPMTYAGDIRDPLLIIHSEQDLRCAIEQAEQLYIRLKLLGRKVEFLRFPEESHGLSRGGRPDRRVIRLEAIADWFNRYLKK